MLALWSHLQQAAYIHAQSLSKPLSPVVSGIGLKCKRISLTVRHIRNVSHTKVTEECTLLTNRFMYKYKLWVRGSKRKSWFTRDYWIRKEMYQLFFVPYLWAHRLLSWGGYSSTHKIMTLRVFLETGVARNLLTMLYTEGLPRNRVRKDFIISR